MVAEIQEKFSGIAPRISPRRLATELAQVAENCRFFGQSLQPLPGIQQVEQLTQNNYLSLHYLNAVDGWRYSTAKLDYVRPFVPGDTYKLTYFTGDTRMMYTAQGETTAYRAGIERPAAPAVAIHEVEDPPGSGTMVPQTGDMSNPLLTRDQSYLVVWVDGHGRVGPTGAFSATVTVGEGAEVAVTRPAGVSNTDWNSAGAVWRVFRTNSTTGGEGIFQYVGEADYTTETLVDGYEPDQLTYVSFSEDWVGPPDGMIGLIQGADNFLLGYKGNEVFASERNVPHAWPYSWGFQERVRGLAPIQGGVLVVTDQNPWLLAGSSPESLQKIELESTAYCASADGLVDMGDFAVYPSEDGLYGVSGTSVTWLTQELHSRDSWAGYQPETIWAFRFQHYYIGFYGATRTNPDGAFMFDVENRVFVDLDTPPVVAASFDPFTAETNVIYVDGATHYRGTFGTAAALTARWRSREIVQKYPVSYKGFRVWADGYPVTLRFYLGDHTETITVPDNKIYRLPAGFKYRTLAYEIETTHRVDLLTVATTLTELI